MLLFLNPLLIKEATIATTKWLTLYHSMRNNGSSKTSCTTRQVLWNSQSRIIHIWNGSWLVTIALKEFKCLKLKTWVNWRVLPLGITASLVRMDLIELWTVQNLNPFGLVVIHSTIIIHLMWTIFLLFKPLILVIIVSIRSHHSHWLVWLMDWFEFTDLPQLQSVTLGESSFYLVHSIVFESDGMDRLMIQICQNYNPFNLVNLLFMVIIVMIERRLAMNPTTTRIHWQCEVRLNELMNE